MPKPNRDNPQDLWDKHNKSVRAYFDKKELFEALITEVAFILNKRMRDLKIEFAFVTSRVKKLDSFLAKIDRKKYPEPIEQTTDIAGVRIIYLYQQELPKIQRLISNNFDVREVVDKTVADVDRFGYGAIHYIVTLSKSVSGTRYEDLKNLRCEIQVRTVLQDAWAIFDHHLRYKHESEIPSSIRRRIHSLSALLENADTQFNDLWKEKSRYIRSLTTNRPLKDLLSEDLNRDSLAVYLRKKFPSFALAEDKGHFDTATRYLDFTKYKKVKDIDEVINKTEEARKIYKGIQITKTASAQLAVALACVDSTYRQLTSYGSQAAKAVNFYDKTHNLTKRSKSRSSAKRSQKTTITFPMKKTSSSPAHSKKIRAKK